MTFSLSLTGLLIGTVAVWRVTHLFWGEDGPGEVFVRLRRAAGNGFWGGLLDCFYCLSLWISVPFAWWLGPTWAERVLYWLAFSGGAIMLERLTAKPQVPPPPALWHEEPLATDPKEDDKTDVMLRR